MLGRCHFKGAGVFFGPRTPFERPPDSYQGLPLFERVRKYLDETIDRLIFGFPL